jgi:hypothetical protein
LVDIDGGGGVDLGSEACCGLKDGMGLVLLFEAMVGKGFIDVVASLDNVFRTYIRYSPGPAKSLCTISSNTFRVEGFTYHCR